MAGGARHRMLSEDDLYLFAKGEWYRSYEKMGAHPAAFEGETGYHFAVWAPFVQAVSVVGDFNGWDASANPLEPDETGGVWEGFVPGIAEGFLYKYAILTAQGETLLKADPYATYAELRPGTASRTYDISGYEWHDADWLARRAETSHLSRPLNIYEVHLGSWKRHDDGDPGANPPREGSYLTYDELSSELVSYVCEMGYTHIEVLPVMEHPFDGSWGYQGTGYYAPTSRFGEPKQFMHFVDACHEAGIGVIIDWVPGGCCADAHGLVAFNGSPLYETGVHPTWGTLKFDHGRGEVASFLISNALFWIDEYHVDGIRVDGVTSMLYLNFGIEDDALKQYNENGGEENLVAVEFVRRLNEVIGTAHPDVMTIAEESTAWPLVTYPPEVGGLGFNLKWDMGWMNDTLHYMQTDFPYRPGTHGLLTFSIMYAFNENFVLPLSHDEVVHGKCSIIQRMPGDYWRQFAGARSLALYQMTHPGAKLNFMGNEICQFIEWRFYEGIEFFLARDYEAHRDYQGFVRALNGLYKAEPALWERAYSEDGFEWIDPDNSAQSLVSYIRHGEKTDDDLVILINFDPAVHEGFRIGVPRPGIYREIFNSDSATMGGSGVTNDADLVSEDEPWNMRDESVVVRVPPLGGTVLKRVGDLPPGSRPTKRKKGGDAKGGKDKTKKKAKSQKKGKPKKSTKSE